MSELHSRTGDSHFPDTKDHLGARDDVSRFLMAYKFGLDEVMTKVNILKEEFSYVHEYNPIEHVRSRLKSPESILRKAERKNCPLNPDDIKARISDIAGVRITCSFIADTYVIQEMLSRQDDITVIEVKDYIASPKSNGYQSLHMIVEVPVFMSDHVEPVRVEIQIRTVAMDFWASVEHKIYYKYDGDVPAELLGELAAAANAVNSLDLKMERLYDEVAKLDHGRAAAMEVTSIAEMAVSDPALAAFKPRGSAA
ncbi:GTP pyrophosphokinase family protein [Glaciihabitans sp. dw_435]|uniref:GTP pyrophosphokinase n=1 Tax=Glaciihabitans sp. dw_435 TaxID=2720081 RepID=UPI001BD33ED2|nr:GTP pyrophosphokinase family protein [Glaciihabitans sp. dw_435]